MERICQRVNQEDHNEKIEGVQRPAQKTGRNRVHAIGARELRVGEGKIASRWRAQGHGFVDRPAPEIGTHIYGAGTRCDIKA